jgi:hypothetical protein
LAGPSGRSVCGQPRLCSMSNNPQPRYVVLGTGAALKAQDDAPGGTDNSVKSSARKASKSPSSKPSLVDVAQQSQEDRSLYISILKAKVRLNVLSPAHQMSDFTRVIVNLSRNIQWPLSNHVKFEPCSIESRVLPSQHSCSK